MAHGRRTLNTAEIAHGLRTNGHPMKAADPANVIGSFLTRRSNSVSDVVRVARGQWGLPEWYPSRNLRKNDTEGTE